MAHGDPTASEVVRLVERCLDAIERHGDATVEEILDEHPEHAEAVRQRLDLLARTGLLADEPAGGARELPELLGDFRLLEPLGRGGMGVVYRAHQVSLGRDVALKLIGPGQLFFPGTRERFLREVEAVARLDHPGVVAIHATGEEQGIPYFAMELVSGLSLDKVLARLPVQQPERLTGADLSPVAREARPSTGTTPRLFQLGWVDACFSVVLEVAEALAHAHERGVLHRDVKPSNVMITPAGQVRLLDFGLARSEGATTITRSGSQMGSLPYMAPEQVRGETGSIGPRTDVYAVGVTLYEMLTLRSPHSADSDERTRARILEGRPVPVERLNSDVPWDAETVCGTAMDLDPARRYPTMQELCDDARRFLERQPIRARRPGVLLRTKRWAQRAPARAAGLLLACLLLVGGPAVYAVLSHMAQADLRVAYEKQSAERRRADQNLQDAIKATDRMLREGSDADFATSPGADPSRRRLLEGALELYESLLARESGDETITARVIGAQTRVAHIKRELGNLDASIAASRRALELCAQLHESRAGEAAVLRSEARFALLVAQCNAGDIEEFRKGCEIQFAEPILTDEAPAFRQSYLRAVLLHLLAEAAQASGDVGGALASAGEAIAVCDRLLGEDSDNEDILSELALSLRIRAYLRGFYLRDANHDADFERAESLLERVLELDPDSPVQRSHLAEVESTWAHVDIVHGRMSEAARRAERADEIFSRLTAEFPLRETFASNYLANAQRLSWAYRLGGDVPRAEEVLEVAVVAADGALGRSPESDTIAFYLAMLTGELSRIVGGRDDLERADELWLSAKTLWERLISVPRPQLRHMLQVGAFYDNLARHQLVREDLESAEASAELALDWHRRMLARTGAEEHAARLGKSYPLLARIQLGRGRPSDAVETLLRAVEEGYVGPDALEDPVFANPLAGRDDYRALRERAATIQAGQ